MTTLTTMTLNRIARMAVLACALLGCRNPADTKTSFSHPETYAELSAAQAERVDALRAAAEAIPEDYEAQKRAGLVMMDYALSGVLPLQPEAERFMERAFALRQDDEELLRTLGRFYNMRAVEHDFSKANMQRKVYAALLADEDPMQMSVDHFVAYSFSMLALTIEAAEERKMLEAFSRLRRLEKVLAARTQAQPDDVELHALAGNFALFFAGYVPVGQRRRVRTGIEHFEYVREHWSEMRPGARDPLRCPNTFENFMFELAEAYLVVEDRERARALYEELRVVSGPITRGKELIAAASEHRLANVDRYVGKTELMPSWPSDLGNCIVCHAYTGDLPDNTFWLADGLDVDLAATPTQAEHREVVVERERGAPQGPAGTSCAPCHFEGGRAVHLLDLGDRQAVAAHQEAIVEAVRSGWMPPDRELEDEEIDALVEWVEGR